MRLLGRPLAGIAAIATFAGILAGAPAPPRPDCSISLGDSRRERSAGSSSPFPPMPRRARSSSGSASANSITCCPSKGDRLPDRRPHGRGPLVWRDAYQQPAHQPDVDADVGHAPRKPDFAGLCAGRASPKSARRTRAISRRQYYRIHGTDAPWTVGQAVSHGCIRLYNNDINNLYNRAPIGTRVVVKLVESRQDPSKSQIFWDFILESTARHFRFVYPDRPDSIGLI